MSGLLHSRGHISSGDTTAGGSALRTPAER